MKMFLRVLIVALTTATLSRGMAEQVEANDKPQEKPQKDAFYVVRLTKLDKSVSCRVLNKDELAELQKKLKNEAMVLPKAYKDVSAEWSKPDASGKKGPHFPLTGVPPSGTMKIVGQFNDSAKADSVMEEESKRCKEAQARIDEAAKSRKSKLPEARRQKLDEKEKEEALALNKLQRKLDELTWQPGSAPDPAWYPRTLDEIKGVLTTLAVPGNSTNIQELYLQRLKSYRFICGVPYEDLKWKKDLEECVRLGVEAFVMNNEASHGPKKPAQMSEEDFAKARHGACGNLFGGLTHPRACVDGWMYDSAFGSFNAVGHRRWCLNPAMVGTAFASKGPYALMQFDADRKSIPDWDYVAFPARGYMPMELNYMGGATAWSCSLNMAKYEAPNKDLVKVTVQPVNEKLIPAGEPWPLDCLTIECQGFGSGPAVVFRPEGGFSDKGFKMKHNTRCRVTIDGLQTRSPQQPARIQYLVHFVDLNTVPDSPEGRRIVAAALRKQLDEINTVTNRVDKWESLTTFVAGELPGSVDASLAKECHDGITELLKDPAVRKEHEAALKYQAVVDMEQKAANSKTKNKKKNNLAAVASAYRDISNQFKDTRAGRKAAADYERLKKLGS